MNRRVLNGGKTAGAREKMYDNKIREKKKIKLLENGKKWRAYYYYYYHYYTKPWHSVLFVCPGRKCDAVKFDYQTTSGPVRFTGSRPS